MPISRPAETPSFFSYAVHYALTSSDICAEDWPDSVKDFDPNPIVIPPYQRKIVWRKKEISEFLDSKSILFGTVILASDGNNSNIILLDGLQRFATATALLKCLYSLVLSPEPTRQEISDKFKLLRAEVASKQPIFEHNDNMLRKYTRKGVSSSYVALFSEAEKFVEEELKNNPEEFANKVTKTFVTKQIAIDKYSGFKNRSELTSTFININSTGIDLSEVDLLRSQIVQQADKMKWDDEDIDAMENHFTDIFQSGRIKGAKVLGKNLYDALELDETKVFQNWNSLKKSDLDDLLNFIADFQLASDAEDKTSPGQKKHPFLYEITQCGELPFTLTLWYFYKHVHLKGEHPDFLGGDFDTRSDQHILLRSFYRKIIDGTIGRIGPIISNFIQEKDILPITIMELANKINSETGAGNLDSFPEGDWMKLSLRRAGRNRARRIFNACLLPDRTDRTGKFHPVEYGTKHSQWNLDHLISKAASDSLEIGHEEMDQIMNLAPLPSYVNIKTKNYSCERKLKTQEICSAVEDKHPYLKWLVNDHYPAYQYAMKIDGKHPLDLPEFLVINSDHAIGDDRIAKICGLLRDKI